MYGAHWMHYDAAVHHHWEVTLTDAINAGIFV